jgi:DNA invertase Pin-like site-specific DNA recombinase
MTDGNLSPGEMQEIAHKYLSEKTRAGIQRAKDAGVHIGRPAAVIDLKKIRDTMVRFHISERRAVLQNGIPLSSFYQYKTSHKYDALRAGLVFVYPKERKKPDGVKI